MTTETRDKSLPEKRRYIRLNSVFPVEYAITPNVASARDAVINWQQGFTFNISRGGIGLSVNQVDDDVRRRLSDGRIGLNLRIRIPLSRPAIKAQARVLWIEENQNNIPSRYLIGLEFTSIAPQDLQEMLGYSRWIRFSSQIAVSLATALLIVLAGNLIYILGLRATNKALVNNLVRIQKEEIQAGADLEGLHKERISLRHELEQYTANVVKMRKELLAAQDELQAKSLEEAQLNGKIKEYDEQVETLSRRIERLMQDRVPVEDRYATVMERENMMTDQLSVLELKKAGLQKTVLKKMYQWLKTHQNPATGLVLSFEGDVEVIQWWAFIYDQALAVNAFMLFDDTQSAQKVLNFFQRNLREPFQGFVNAYYVDSGNAAEYTIHVGPNTWIGIAALQYIAHTGDHSFLPMAKAIGDWLIQIQESDPAGGLRGGPKISWFATEHNLDAYAFFGMLARITNEEKYSAAQEKILSWLKTYALSPHSKDYTTPPVKRGRGDSTIATDTFAWSIAAIGPEKLVAMQMDPEQIMQFAEEHCAVTVNFERPSGTVVEASGFDFSKTSHMPRGGLVSPEWTAQMIVSYQMLGKYFAKQGEKAKAGYYGEKSQYYLDELNKLVISSPSSMGQGEGCLPYATLEDADTGHGWRTPKGADTGSIAGTAYMMMAIKGFNPLVLEGR